MQDYVFYDPSDGRIVQRGQCQPDRIVETAAIAASRDLALALGRADSLTAQMVVDGVIVPRPDAGEAAS